MSSPKSPKETKSAKCRRKEDWMFDSKREEACGRMKILSDVANNGAAPDECVTPPNSSTAPLDPGAEQL